MKEKYISGGEMVRLYLEQNGYDGLCTDECGCELADLMPCGGEYAMDCVAGHKTKCTCNEDCDNIYRIKRNCEFSHIVAGEIQENGKTKEVRCS